MVGKPLTKQMKLQESQEKISEELNVQEENKHQWQGIEQFAPLITLSVIYYIWNTL